VVSVRDRNRGLAAVGDDSGDETVARERINATAGSRIRTGSSSSTLCNRLWITRVRDMGKAESQALELVQKAALEYRDH
jgi:hypothetical protein